MLKPWLSRIIQIVGTLALVALAVIVYRRTDWSKGFSPDGIMTLIAGVLAFAAVQWQMWDQRRTSRQEQMRQKRAVATAILFEIDSFYRYFVRDASALLKDTRDNEPFVAKSTSAFSFTAYVGNAGNLGQLSQDIVQGIVAFYGCATVLLTTMHDHSEAVKRSLEARDNIDWGYLAKQYFTHMTASFPALKVLTYNVSKTLCTFAKIEFKPPSIAVAAENMDALREEITKMGDGEMFEPES
jgi:hypothetical protein